MAGKVKGGKTQADDADELEELMYKIRNPFRVTLKEQRGMYPEYLLNAMKKMDALKLPETEY